MIISLKAVTDEGIRVERWKGFFVTCKTMASNRWFHKELLLLKWKEYIINPNILAQAIPIFLFNLGDARHCLIKKTNNLFVLIIT